MTSCASAVVTCREEAGLVGANPGRSSSVASLTCANGRGVSGLSTPRTYTCFADTESPEDWKLSHSKTRPLLLIVHYKVQLCIMFVLGSLPEVCVRASHAVFKASQVNTDADSPPAAKGIQIFL